MIPIYSPTEKVIVLAGFLDEKKTFLFPSDNVALPGLHFQNKPLHPISDQISERIKEHCQIAQISFELNMSFADTFSFQGEEYTLYLGTVLHEESLLPRYLHTLPYLMKSMSKDRSRLPYLRTLQILAGAHLEEIQVGEDSRLLNIKSRE